MLLEKAAKILQQPVCDHCLGRQFAQLLSGTSNDERGRLLRTLVAMGVDKGKDESKEEAREKAAGKVVEDAGQNVISEVTFKQTARVFSHTIDMSNFTDFRFHNLEAAIPKKAKKCSVCGDIFSKLDVFANNAIKKAKGYEFRTFLVGTRLNSALLDNEEDLWERVGIEYCEPLKAEINRSVGKIIEKRAAARFDAKQPDVAFLIDMPSGRASLSVNSLYIYGEYQKLVRGIPQTKWPSGKYKTSVEQIIAKPFMQATRATGHKLHGLGREDIDARCLGWRPFVLELVKPKKRIFDYAKAAKKIPKTVRIRKMRLSSVSEVRRIKEARADKTYKAIVTTDKKISRSDLKKLKPLVAVIDQKTPQRVLHRRADKYRKRRVRSIATKLLGPKKFSLTVRSEGGLYIKELITGDAGRTKPSVASLLGCDAQCKQLDVLKIHAKF